MYCIVQTSLTGVSTAELVVTVRMTNADVLADKSTAGTGHTCVLLIGNDDNSIVYKARVRSEHVLLLLQYDIYKYLTTSLRPPPCNACYTNVWLLQCDVGQ